MGHVALETLGFAADIPKAEAGSQGAGLKTMTHVSTDNVGDVTFSPSHKSAG